MSYCQSIETIKELLHDDSTVRVMAEKSEEITDEGGNIEILNAGKICPKCRFSGLVREGSQVFCPVCNYGLKKCS
jgi:hypothetical protein